MLVRELVERIDTEETPIHFHDIPFEQKDYCYTLIATSAELALLRNQSVEGKDNSEEELGVHLVNVNLQQVYDSYLDKAPITVQKTCDRLSAKFAVSGDRKVFAYVLFTILHEIGHWQHLIQSGLTRIDYWRKYEGDRDSLWKDFQFAYHFMCKNESARQDITNYFNLKYEQLPSEVFANNYAEEKISLYL